jgi:hypothetical protein
MGIKTYWCIKVISILILFLSFTAVARSQELEIFPHSIQKIGTNRAVFLAKRQDSPQQSSIWQYLINCDHYTYLIMEQYTVVLPKISTVKLTYKIEQAKMDTQLWLAITYVCHYDQIRQSDRSVTNAN